MDSAWFTATGTYSLFDSHIQDEFNFNEHIFCAAPTAGGNNQAWTAFAAASNNSYSSLESTQEVYSSPESIDDPAFSSPEHLYAADNAWVSFGQGVIAPNHHLSLAMLKGGMTQASLEMRSASEISINNDIFEPSPTTDMASAQERGKKPQQPRNRRQSSGRRIKPQSETHAYQLDRNRVAATAYRCRKKEEMEKMQHNLEKSKNKNRMLRSLLQRLKNEALDLQKEILKHCNCVCRKTDCPTWFPISESYSDTLKDRVESGGSSGSPESTSSTNISWQSNCVSSLVPGVEEGLAGFEHW